MRDCWTWTERHDRVVVGYLLRDAAAWLKEARAGSAEVFEAVVGKSAVPVGWG
jgi:hypothetical protein